ncbi:hypothetical protein JDXMQMMX_CDS10 [Acinetobacter phage vB_AbaM_AB4P2]|nr:hypothetical protein JDXMQMMX_CDS10 [Acinetobacter phage vB_AbaM_AB4P2]
MVLSYQHTQNKDYYRIAQYLYDAEYCFNHTVLRRESCLLRWLTLNVETQMSWQIHALSKVHQNYQEPLCPSLHANCCCQSFDILHNLAFTHLHQAKWRNHFSARADFDLLKVEHSAASVFFEFDHYHDFFLTHHLM